MIRNYLLAATTLVLTSSFTLVVPTPMEGWAAKCQTCDDGGGGGEEDTEPTGTTSSPSPSSSPIRIATPGTGTNSRLAAPVLKVAGIIEDSAGIIEDSLSPVIIPPIPILEVPGTINNSRPAPPRLKVPGTINNSRPAPPRLKVPGIGTTSSPLTPSYGSYTVKLKTGNIDGAGTDADVEILVNGQVTSGYNVLDVVDRDDREKNQLDTYSVTTPSYLGNISSIVLRVKKANEDRPDWFLDYVEIIDHNSPQGVTTYYFPYSNWIRPNSYTEWVYATIYPTNTTTISGTASPQQWQVCVISNATASRYTATAAGYSAQDAASNLKAELFLQNTGGVGFDVIPGACL